MLPYHISTGNVRVPFLASVEAYFAHRSVASLQEYHPVHKKLTVNDTFLVVSVLEGLGGGRWDRAGWATSAQKKCGPLKEAMY